MIIPIRAPQGGVIVQHNVREGMFVTPATSMFTIVDLSEVWVMVDVFEQQLAWVRPGLTAEIRTAAYPGKVWEGEVEFVYPEVHPKSRTLRARLRPRLRERSDSRKARNSDSGTSSSALPLRTTRSMTAWDQARSTGSRIRKIRRTRGMIAWMKPIRSRGRIPYAGVISP